MHVLLYIAGEDWWTQDLYDLEKLGGATTETNVNYLLK